MLLATSPVSNLQTESWFWVSMFNARNLFTMAIWADTLPASVQNGPVHCKTFMSHVAVDCEQRSLKFGWLRTRGIQAGYVRRYVVNVNFTGVGPCSGDMLFILLWHDSNTVNTAVMTNRSTFQNGIVIDSFSIFIVRFWYTFDPLVTGKSKYINFEQDNSTIIILCLVQLRHLHHNKFVVSSVCCWGTSNYISSGRILWWCIRNGEKLKKLPSSTSWGDTYILSLITQAVLKNIKTQAWPLDIEFVQHFVYRLISLQDFVFSKRLTWKVDFEIFLLFLIDVHVWWGVIGNGFSNSIS